MKLLAVKAGESIKIAHAVYGQWDHVFQAEEIDAINAALAAQRPLLVQGEPGCGKSELARAAAAALGREFRGFTVDATTEPDELRYSFDAVARLADAQVFQVKASGSSASEAADDPVPFENYVRPGPLWWAFDWRQASEQAAKVGDSPGTNSSDAGVVLLIDEIDKADSSVPNGLLAALGDGTFQIPRLGSVSVQPPYPLVVVTTNDERSLPWAFLRRCFVLSLGLPKAGLEDWLVARGKAHFPKLGSKLIRKAADQLAVDRASAETGPRPGLAELLDVLRALDQFRQAGTMDPADAFDRISRFSFQKYQDPSGGSGR